MSLHRILTPQGRTLIQHYHRTNMRILRTTTTTTRITWSNSTHTAFGSSAFAFRRGPTVAVHYSSPFELSRLDPHKACISNNNVPVHFFATFSKPPPPPPNNNNKKPGGNISRLSSLGAVSSLAFLSLTKSKSILAALKLTKFASLGSMLVTIGAYTTLYGLPYATGMVGLILVHESGHALMMRHKKIPFSPMIFVPFMGAAIAAKKPPKNAYDDAMVALAGPALGSVGAGVVWGAGMATGSQLCLALADFGFMVNLFNLIPVGMLDGGRIGNALSPYTGLVGVGVAGGMIYSGMVSNPIFYIITLAGGYQCGMRLWNHHRGIVDSSLPVGFYRISQREKMMIGSGYFGLMGALFMAMAVNGEYKKTPEQIQWEEKISNARQRMQQEGIVAVDGLTNDHDDV
jgi:Zn-dependent protease